METGRELDALVAEKVMGVTCVHKRESRFVGASGFGYYVTECAKCKMYEPKSVDVPPYSTDITAAWHVVERICSSDVFNGVSIATVAISDGSGNMRRIWRARCSKGSRVGEADADSAAHAICLAALKAVGATDGR